MSWLLYRWAWRLEAPLSIGLPPSGNLNRCRLYVPARNLWGALTAELAQRRATGFPAYAKVGQDVRKDVRLTYLFPAEETNRGWRAWLPRYERDQGLVWQREDEANRENWCSDREMRQCLLLARPGTAIDHTSDTAAEGTLRETECISQHWRDRAKDGAKPVALVGYLFVREGADPAGAIETVDELFLGGDARYGLGRVRRVAWNAASEVFGPSPELDRDDPSVTTERLLAHAGRSDRPETMRGDLETLGGWDFGKFYAPPGDPAYWKPGSVSYGMQARWTIQDSGLWKCE